MKKKILLTSIAVIALCLCLIAGSTFALFTTSTNVNIAVTAGNLDVEAGILGKTLKLRSLGDAVDEFNRDVFANGGIAKLDGGKLILDRMTPGDGLCFQVQVKNTGDVNVKYKVNWSIPTTAKDKDNKTVDVDWSKVLKITVTDANGNAFTNTDANAYYDVLGEPGKVTVFNVIVEFVNGTAKNDNDYQGTSVDVTFTVETVQQNGIDANGNKIETP